MSIKKNISRDDIANAINTEFGFSRKDSREVLPACLIRGLTSLLGWINVGRPLMAAALMAAPGAAWATETQGDRERDHTRLHL